MNDFTFEATPWELTLDTLGDVDNFSAARFLTLLEGESEQDVEYAFEDLEERGIALDISDLPRPGGTGEAALRLRREAELSKQRLDPRVLEPNDPLRLYLEEIAATPAFGDEALLAEQSAAGDENAMVALTNLGLSRVVELARQYTGWGVLLLDLIQEGSLGLWQAIRDFEGGDYATHRDWWIRQYLAKAVVLQARSGGVGQKLRQAMEDYRAVDERLLGDLGRNPTLEEIALELHMSPEEAEMVRRNLENARLISQAKAPAQPEEEEDEDETRHVEDTALFQMRQRILDLLSVLSEEDAKLLTLRFGLEGGLPLSPEDTGRRLGLTPEEVVAREAAALAQLRNG
ncbi:MAG: sigma-70 family RNA polymerase sigma factor [Oscillospiraceae bacterium]|nr:sigma-70 family RNA polymerase sigma factor [Oscillospiraceae bacterium]